MTSRFLFLAFFWGVLAYVGQARTFSLSSDTIRFQLCAEFWKDGRPVKGTTLIFQPINPAFPYTPIVVALDTVHNCTEITLIESDYLPGTTFRYSAFLPNIGPYTTSLNGVTIADLCTISQHILGINPLPSYYAIFAADANHSGSITTFDLVEYRKLIQGIYTELPNNVSWQTFPDYCKFPDPNNPFSGSCPDTISLSDLMTLNGDTAKVICVKTGDADGDAQLIGTPNVAPDAIDTLQLWLPQGPILAGQTLALPIKMDKNFAYGSLQASFYLDPAKAVYDSISAGGITIPPGSVYYNPQTGAIRIVSIQDLFMGSQVIPAGAVHFYIHIKALQDAQLEDILEGINNGTDGRTFALGPNCGGYFELEPTYKGAVATFSPEWNGVRVQWPSPNPFTDQTALVIELEDAKPALLEVVDLTGRRIFSEEKSLPAGTYQWEIPGLTLASGSLGIWRLRIGAQIVCGKLVRE